MPGYELRPPDLINLAGQTDEQVGRDHISHSAIGTLLSCQQRFRWKYEQRLEPAVAAAPLLLGRAFADALEHGDPSAGARAIFNQAESQVELAAGSPWIQAPDPKVVATNATIVEAAAGAYLNRWGRHGQTREVEYRARIRNPVSGGRYSLTHDLVGRLDALDRANGVLVEDKLRGRLPDGSEAMRLRFDRQVTVGCYLAWRCEGIDIGKVCYRVVKKPGIRQRKDETHDQYLDRIRAEYKTRPDDYLWEETLTRSRADFLRLEQELWTWVSQIRDARQQGVWPRNIAACSEYAGCSYLALCAREPGAEHQFVEREREPAVVSLPLAPNVMSEEKEAA